MHYALCNVQYAVCTLQGAMRNVEYAKHNVYFAACNIQCAIFGVQFTRCAARFSLHIQGGHCAIFYIEDVCVCISVHLLNVRFDHFCLEVVQAV